MPRFLRAPGSFFAKATFVGDVNPLQNAEFCKAMSVHLGSLGTSEITEENRHYYDALEAFGHELPGDQLDERAQPVYYFLAAMRSTLEENKQIVSEFQQELGDTLRELLDKQRSIIASDLERYVEDVPKEWRTFWLFVAFAAIAWQTSLVKGPDPAFIPLRLPVLIRSAAIFSDWILHPTMNRRQLADMFTQRLFTASPQQVLYTIAMVTSWNGASPGAYEESWYQPINIGLSLGAVTAVIIGTEATAFNIKKKVTKGTATLAPHLNESPRRKTLRQRLRDNAGKMRVVQSWGKKIRENYEISPGESNAFGQMMGDIDALITTCQQLGQILKANNNPEKSAKLQPLYVCITFSVLQNLAAISSPISLGMAISWSEYALYRLAKHAWSDSRTEEETWKLLDQVGGIVPAQLLLHSLPMAINSKAFEQQWLVIFSTTLLSVLQTTVSHKTGPMVSVGSKFVIKKSKIGLGAQKAKDFASAFPYRRLLKFLMFMLERSDHTGEESRSSAAPFLWEMVRDWEGEDAELWYWLKEMEENEGEFDADFSTGVWEIVDEDAVPEKLRLSKNAAEEHDTGSEDIVAQLTKQIEEFLVEIEESI